MINDISDISSQLAVLNERLARQIEDLAVLRSEIEEMRIHMLEMRAMADRWKGGFIVLVGIGGVVGWALSSWESILLIFRGGGHH